MTVCAFIGFNYGLARFFKVRKALYTRMIGLLAPAGIAVLYFLCVRTGGWGAGAVVAAVESIVIALASYYHLKHLVIKDVDYGIIRSLRNYNLLALVYAFLCMVEMILKSAPLSPIWIIAVDVLICVILLIFIPFLEWGVRKWII